MPASSTIKRVCAASLASFLLLACLGGCSPSATSQEIEELVETAATSAGVNREDVAAVVEGRVITQQQVDEYLESMLVRYGYEDDESFESYLKSTGMDEWDVRSSVLHDLVDRALIESQAEKLSISVDDATVAEHIEELAGRYPTRQAWLDALAASGYTEESYFDTVRYTLLTALLREAVIEVPEPTQEEISEYAVVVAPTYQGKRSSHILFPSSEYALACQVRQEIADGADFAEMAERYSVDGSADDGGDMGWDCMTTFASEYQAALDELEVGEVSPVVRSNYGYHIIMCTDEYVASYNADGSIDIDAIPEDLLDAIIGSMKGSVAGQMFDVYLDNLEATATLAVFDEDGNQVDPQEVGLATEERELIAPEDAADAAASQPTDEGTPAEQGDVDLVDPADALELGKAHGTRVLAADGAY